MQALRYPPFRGHSPRCALATVTAVTGKTFAFGVEARDGVRKIGAGTHVRGAVNLARFEERLKTE